MKFSETGNLSPTPFGKADCALAGQENRQQSKKRMAVTAVFIRWKTLLEDTLIRLLEQPSALHLFAQQLDFTATLAGDGGVF